MTLYADGVRLRTMTQHHTHDNWSAWLEQLSSPLGDIACGEDLKYEEDFKYLKSSFSGVSELDCKHIFITATRLTSDKSKDLRIASYLLFAAASEYGVAGLASGLALFNHFVESFLPDVHPTKDKARKAVHTWLLGQQNRIIALAEQQGQFAPELIVELQQQLNKYAHENVRKLDQDAGPLSDFMQWADKLQKKYPVIVEKVETVKPEASQAVEKHTVSSESADQAQNVTAQNVSHSAVAAPLQNIESDTQFAEMLRKLLAFDKEKQNIARLMRLSRAARWSDIKLPPNEQGKTRIPAPRSTAFSPISNALNNDDYFNALMLGEALFMEGAMHFNLDLQAMQLNALKGLGNPVVIKQLELELYQLTSRFPQLSQLTYDDGSALCSAKTKDIISDIAGQFNQIDSAAGANNTEFEQAEATAKEQVEQGKLDNALVTLGALPASDAFTQANVQLLKAKMCLLSERYDFAAPMLVELVQKIDKHELGQWQPAFCMQVWRNAVLCFDTLAASGDDALAGKSQTLKQKMILTQPEVALGWI
ncbi:TssA family type VI secretion system protein [Colwellia sp. D2M02]|uniref:TssA family type VI secretion system protein n=1 Tax=Colwellia sp. D2M02 TaxID=2841562 RepID=UPI001C0A15D7|nr:TssA family type VI secretion system protein [Colwellia sp. D2M02]MBU2894377.1 TssA family type VI secretion system protein [Colwellia sp. D2M02]